MFEKLMMEKDWCIQIAINCVNKKDFELAAFYYHAAEGLQDKADRMTIGEIDG